LEDLQMEKETSTKLRTLADDMECIAIEIEQLADLLQVYSEHREGEMEWLRIGDPSMVLKRRGLGDSLLDALGTKVHEIKAQLEQASSTGYEIARAVRASTKE
jgi:hypothetical protein